MSDVENLAAEEIDEFDLRALGKVAELYDELDPVPAGLVERIQFGITLDALHAEIAELQRSSDLAGVRSDDPAASQTVTFTSANLTTMITITPLSPERARIDGWAAPGEGLFVELRATDTVLYAHADADGRFVFEHVTRGLVQFLIRQPDGSVLSPVITPSIEI